MILLVSRGKTAGKKRGKQVPPALVKNLKMSALSASLSEKMIVEELGQWLVENGFSEDIRQCFERKLAGFITRIGITACCS